MNTEKINEFFNAAWAAIFFVLVLFSMVTYIDISSLEKQKLKLEIEHLKQVKLDSK